MAKTSFTSWWHYLQAVALVRRALALNSISWQNVAALARAIRLLTLAHTKHYHAAFRGLCAPRMAHRAAACGAPRLQRTRTASLAIAAGNALH